jgi:hypothetical protein
MSDFKSEVLGLQDVANMVEREFPTAVWGVGKCSCEAPEGPYAGTIHSEDWTPGLFALTPNGLVPMSSGWVVHCHAKTAADALGFAYGKALGEGRT